jgi:hypothetical protein
MLAVSTIKGGIRVTGQKPSSNGASAGSGTEREPVLAGK